LTVSELNIVYTIKSENYFHSFMFIIGFIHTKLKVTSNARPLHALLTRLYLYFRQYQNYCL